MSVILSELPYFAQRVALYAGARYLTRKLIERFLGVRTSPHVSDVASTRNPNLLRQPVVKRLAAADPKLPLAKPSVEFDLYQRAARAIFALIIIGRCWNWLATDHTVEIAAEVSPLHATHPIGAQSPQAKRYGWPAFSEDSIEHVLQPAPLSGRTIMYDMLGWYVTVRFSPMRTATTLSLRMLT